MVNSKYKLAKAFIIIINMGHNLISACHKCKTKIFHFRNEENKTMLSFYKKHAHCAKFDIRNVETVMDNNGTDQYWAEDSGYDNDSLQV